MHAPNSILAAPDRAGEAYSVPPDPLLNSRGRLLRERETERDGREGRGTDGREWTGKWGREGSEREGGNVEFHHLHLSNLTTAFMQILVEHTCIKCDRLLDPCTVWVLLLNHDIVLHMDVSEYNCFGRRACSGD